MDPVRAGNTYRRLRAGSIQSQRPSVDVAAGPRPPRWGMASSGWASAGGPFAPCPGADAPDAQSWFTLPSVRIMKVRGAPRSFAVGDDHLVLRSGGHPDLGGGWRIGAVEGQGRLLLVGGHALDPDDCGCHRRRVASEQATPESSGSPGSAWGPAGFPLGGRRGARSDGVYGLARGGVFGAALTPRAAPGRGVRTNELSRGDLGGVARGGLRSTRRRSLQRRAPGCPVAADQRRRSVRRLSVR